MGAGQGRTASVPAVSPAVLLSGRTKPVQTPATVPGVSVRKDGAAEARGGGVQDGMK